MIPGFFSKIVTISVINDFPLSEIINDNNNTTTNEKNLKNSGNRDADLRGWGHVLTMAIEVIEKDP